MNKTLWSQDEFRLTDILCCKEALQKIEDRLMGSEIMASPINGLQFIPARQIGDFATSSHLFIQAACSTLAKLFVHPLWSGDHHPFLDGYSHVQVVLGRRCMKQMFDKDIKQLPSTEDKQVMSRPKIT